MTRLDLGLGVILVVALVVAGMLALVGREIPELVENIALLAAGGFGVRQHHRVLPSRKGRA